MGNSGEGKQFKPFDLSGNPTWKLFLEKNKCFSEFLQQHKVRVAKGIISPRGRLQELSYQILKAASNLKYQPLVCALQVTMQALGCLEC